MIKKVISVAQMSAVLGVSLTATREGIARDRFPFAYAWQSPEALSSIKRGLGHSLSIL